MSPALTNPVAMKNATTLISSAAIATTFALLAPPTKAVSAVEELSASSQESTIDQPTGIGAFSCPINKAFVETAAGTNEAIPLLPQHNWSLPIAGQIRPAQVQPVPVQPKKPQKLDAGICLSQGSKISGRLDDLLGAALDHDEKVPELAQKLAHYNTRTQKVIAETKDATNYLIPYRGFGPSIDAADVVLDEKIKVGSKASAELAYQKQLDEKHLKLVQCMMQMAAGMGMNDQTKGFELTNQGLEDLTKVVGKDEAEKTMAMLSQWRNELVVPDTVYGQGAWDPSSHQAKLSLIREHSLENDAVVKQIKDRLHKYNKKSKFSRVSSQVIQTTLGAASLTPTFIGPGAKIALLAYVMATGGPEQCKLLKELYLDKRLESRWKVLNEESHLALANYQVGILTKNPLLIAMSESLVEEMSGADTVQDVFGVRIFFENEKRDRQLSASGSNGASM